MVLCADFQRKQKKPREALKYPGAFRAKRESIQVLLAQRARLCESIQVIVAIVRKYPGYSRALARKYPGNWGH